MARRVILLMDLEASLQFCALKTCSNSISGWSFGHCNKVVLQGLLKAGNKLRFMLKCVSFLIVNYEGEVTAWFSGSRRDSSLTGHLLSLKDVFGSVDQKPSTAVKHFSKSPLRFLLLKIYPGKSRNFTTVKIFFQMPIF